MYILTRQQAAEKLEVSTRTLDRYVRDGKIRSRKKGKVVYIHEGDIRRITGEKIMDVEIYPQNSQGNLWNLEEIIKTFSQTIEKKDKTIQELSYKLGKMESEMLAILPKIEEQKTAQLLLETSKQDFENEKNILKRRIHAYAKYGKQQERINAFLIVCVVILITISFLMWMWWR